MPVRRILPGDERTVLRADRLFDRRKPDPDAVRSFLADRRNVLLFAFARRKAVGYLRATELRQLSTRHPQMFLYEITVEEAFRRQGVGKALVNTLLQYCRERGFEEVFVLTDPANVAAVALYRSTGAVTETPADRMFVYPLGPALEPAARSRGTGGRIYVTGSDETRSGPIFTADRNEIGRRPGRKRRLHLPPRRRTGRDHGR